MFNPMQSQAALQNPARFPDQKLQQYAAGKPPQPSGQVTSDMAQQELASRGQERQAAQRQQAMQNNPKNSPTIYQQLMMKEQAIQQKEQQLGMASEMMNRKAQELAERERGIGALPIRSDMFTAMDGGIVFSGGGAVQRFDGRQGSTVGFLADPRSQMYTNAGENVVEEAKAKLARLESLLPTTSSEQARTALLTEIASLRNTVSKYSRVPSTTGEPEPTIYAPEPKKEGKKDEGKKSPSTTGATSLPNLGDITSGLYDKYMGRMAPFMATPADVAESRAGIRGQLAGVSSAAEQARPLGSSGMSPNDLMALIRKRMESIDEAEKTAMLSPEEKELMRFKNTQEMQKEYDEYARGRGERQQKVAEAIRGKDPEVLDFLMAMAAGGPGKTLAETLSRMVPGAAKLRVEQQAREMAAAKFLAEAEEKAAQADLAEKRGQRDVAAKLLQDEQALRLKAFEIKQGAARTGIQGLAAMQESQDRQASETRRAQEAAERQALELRKYEEAPERAKAQAEYEAKLRREGRVPGVDERLYDDLTSNDPVRVNRAKTYLSGRYNTGARGQLTELQVAKAVADFNDEFKGARLREQHGTVEKYLEYLRTTRANIGQGTSESSGEVVYDTSGKRVQ
jgi:hypothetical protein